MKPDWKDAPDWANWLAQDEDGSWWWFWDKPYLHPSYPGWSYDEGNFKRAGHSAVGDWTNSLEARPET